MTLHQKITCWRRSRTDMREALARIVTKCGAEGAIWLSFKNSWQSAGRDHPHYHSQTGRAAGTPMPTWRPVVAAGFWASGRNRCFADSSVKSVGEFGLG